MSRAAWAGMLTVLVVAVVVAAAFAGMVLGLNDQSDAQRARLAADQPAPPSWGTTGNALTTAELHALAGARTAAIRDGDLDRFLAPLAPDAKLRRSQTRLFNNLRKLDLQVATYKPIGDLGRASDSFGRRVTLEFDVAFEHQLRRFDTQPAVEWYRWTVTKASRDAQPVITAVTGAPELGDHTVAWPAPWDRYPEMQVVTGRRVLMLVDAPMAATARRWLPTAEAAAQENLATWRASGATGQINEHYVLTIVPNRRELDALWDAEKDYRDAAGIAIPMRSPDPIEPRSGSVRIVLDGSSGYFSDTAGVLELMRHEMAHALADGLTGTSTTLDGWITEGFAEYVAHLGRRHSSKADGARRAVAAGAKLRLEPYRFDYFNIIEGQTHVDYFTGHQAMRYLAKKYGPKAPFLLVSAYYRDADRDAALAAVGAPDFNTFRRAALAYAKAELRKNQ
ncbi:MAG TPA: hypothetical protein VFO77_01470 [Actinoplanes sp.]|nr:hypothetical protein [Actinoplanes sp.]